MARRDDKRGKRDREEQDEFVEKLVHINRVAKTVKGGRNMSFAALVVVGDGKGQVGFGKGKAREVPECIRKGTELARKSLIRVPMREGRTLHHDCKGRHGAGKVLLWPNARRIREPGYAGCCGEIHRQFKPVQHGSCDI